MSCLSPWSWKLCFYGNTHNAKGFNFGFVVDNRKFSCEKIKTQSTPGNICIYYVQTQQPLSSAVCLQEALVLQSLIVLQHRPNSCKVYIRKKYLCVSHNQAGYINVKLGWLYQGHIIQFRQSSFFSEFCFLFFYYTIITYICAHVVVCYYIIYCAK